MKAKVRRGIAAMGLGAGLLLLLAFTWPIWGWWVAELLRPSGIPTVTPATVQSRLNEPNAAPLLLDVRSAEEYAVSHLPGAIHFPPGSPIDERVRTAEAVVAYCAVGVRSGREIERLRGAGLSGAKNLEGSIFRWAIAGRPLENKSGETHLVHPYDLLWGQLLPAELRAWSPPRRPRGRE